MGKNKKTSTKVEITKTEETEAGKGREGKDARPLEGAQTQGGNAHQERHHRLQRQVSLLLAQRNRRKTVPPHLGAGSAPRDAGHQQSPAQHIAAGDAAAEDQHTGNPCPI